MEVYGKHRKESPFFFLNIRKLLQGRATRRFMSWEVAMISVLPLFLIALALYPHPALASSMNSAANDWVDEIADRNSGDILRKFEKKIPVKTRFRDAAKDMAKDLIKDELKKKIFAENDEISIAMDDILRRIKDRLGRSEKRHGGPCNLAAKNAAYSAMPTGARVLAGAKSTFIDVFSDTLTGGKPPVDLTEMGKKALNKLRKQFEDDLDDYLDDYSLETYSAARRVGGGDYEIRVIWFKKTGQIRYLILGDCHCNAFATGKGSDKAQVSRFSLYGNGRARWVGKSKEKTAPSRSSVAGSIRIYKPRIKASCCRDGQEVLVKRIGDPWNLAPASATVQKAPSRNGRPQTGADPEKKRTRTQEEALNENRPTDIDPSGKALDVPEGPVCQSEKDRLRRDAAFKLRDATEVRQRAEAQLEILEADQKDGLKVTEAQFEAARAKIQKTKAEEKHQKATLDAIDKLKVKPNCSEKHASFMPQQEEDGAPVPALAAQTLLSEASSSDGTQYLVLAPEPKDKVPSAAKAGVETDPIDGNLENCAIAFSDAFAGLLKTTKLDMAHGKTEYACPGLTGGFGRDLATHCKSFEKAGNGLFTSTLAWQAGLPTCQIEAQGMASNRPLRLDAACALAFEEETGANIQTQLRDNGLAFRWQNRHLQCFIVTRKSVLCYRAFLENGTYPPDCALQARTEPSDRVSQRQNPEKE